MILSLLGWVPFFLQIATGLWLIRANSSESNLNTLPPTVNHILSTAVSAAILVLLLVTGRTGLFFWISAAMTGYSAWWFLKRLTKR